MQDLMNGLRAMADSGDPWSLSVLAQAKGFFTKMLDYMRDGELADFKGTITLPKVYQTDASFQKHFKRVFGDRVRVEYSDIPVMVE